MTTLRHIRTDRTPHAAGPHRLRTETWIHPDCKPIAMEVAEQLAGAPAEPPGTTRDVGRALALALALTVIAYGVTTLALHLIELAV